MKTIRQQHGWDSIPLRYVCQLNPAVDFTGFEEDDDLTFLPMDRVKNGYFISNTDKFGKYAASYNAFEEGDIILAKVTPCFENGNIAIAENLVNGKGFGSSELFVIRPTKIERRFLFYYFQCSVFKLEGEASMTGAGGLKRVSPELLRQHHLPFPSQETQRLIADYLDRETARIDALVAEKEKMLALLEEKRAALISRAVTKGLNPDAPMKPSGLDWLGEIPEHWDIRTIKRISSRIDTGTTPSVSYMDGTLQPEFVWFTPGDFENNEILTQSKRKIPLEAIENGEAKMFKANSIMVIGIGATLGKVATSPIEFSANQQINVICPSKEIAADFLLYALQGYEKVFRAHANSATLPILNQERLGDIHIPYPPMEEQHLIATKIREKRSAELQINKELSDSISLLKERRAALITAAVTGQIPLEEMRA